MANITEYLKQIQALTNKNLDILQAINQSFFTKRTNTTVQIENEKYIIPSFLALENKLQLLEDNFENLVNAPKTGVAAFNFNGNTQEIQMISYANVPESILPTFDGNEPKFNVKSSAALKDMLSPTPYLKMNVTSLPDSVLKVNVKKIVFKSAEAAALAKGYLKNNPSAVINYLDLIALLTNTDEGKDYVTYDKVYDLPVRDNSKTGSWHIEKLEKNYLDENLNEFYELYVKEDLTITDENGNETELNYREGEGDDFKYLVCNDGKIKLEVIAANAATKYLKVKVLYGGYANLIESTSGEEELSKLVYFNDSKYADYKHIDVPLEEDQYVAIFIDAINQLNVKSVTNEGYIYDTYLIKNENGKYFKDYYVNVSNIGDKLEALSKMFADGLDSYTDDKVNELVTYKPKEDSLVYDVKQINAHLNNSSTIETIRELHAQKQQTKKTQANLLNEISNLKKLINGIDFNDTTGAREVYQQQLADKQSEYDNAQATITNLVDHIADEANKSVLPIENAKYHIRGFINIPKLDDKISIIKTEVYYKYKNKNSLSGNAMSIGEDSLYSDWNLMDSEYNVKGYSKDKESGSYVYLWEDVDTTKNEPSFNQVDIPITQGEIVDIKYRYIYDTGYPFVKVTSEWSEVISVEFPEELQSNVEILDIVNENNDEVKKNAFDGMLTKYGVQDHMKDKVIDNDTTFMHDAASVTSGFRTDEQRIISLKEKLWEMNNDLVKVKDEVFGTSSNALTVTVSNESSSLTLNENAENIFIASSYKELVEKNSFISEDKPIVHENLSLILQNPTQHTIKLYPMFYGKNHIDINSNVKSKYDIKEYYINDTEHNSPRIAYYDINNKLTTSAQKQNQVITFRAVNAFDGSALYNEDAQSSMTAGAKMELLLPLEKPVYAEMGGTSRSIHSLSIDNAEIIVPPPFSSDSSGYIACATLCPFVSKFQSIQPQANENCIILAPGEGIKLSLLWDFNLTSTSPTAIKTISFDVRTSLYDDPHNYILTIRSDYNKSIKDDDNTKNRYNTTIIN